MVSIPGRSAIVVALVLGACVAARPQDVQAGARPAEIDTQGQSLSGSVAFSPSSCPVHLHLDLRAALSQRDLDTFARELSEIWKPYDVPLEWQSAETNRQTSGLRLNVVIGSEPVRRTSSSVIDSALGSTVFSEAGLPRDTLYASASSAWESIRGAEYRGVAVGSLPRLLRDQLLAEALARVVAHELGHILLSSARHTRSGLMRAVFSPDDLVGGRSRFRLEPSDGRWLKQFGHCRAVDSTAR